MIKNKTKNTVLCSKKKFLSTVISKAIGLMFSKTTTDTGYVFIMNKKTRIDLHMFFVFFPIDVLFLDENKKVVEIKERLMPFTLYYSKHKAKYVIELPEGTIKISKTDITDNIIF